MIIAVPRNADSLRNILYTASLRENSPMAIRYPRGTAKEADLSKPLHRVEIGKGEKLREGKDIAFISAGPIAEEVSDAIKLLEADGIDAAHYHMTFIKPLDGDILREVAALGCPVVTVEDGTVCGGLGTAVTEWLIDNDTATSGQVFKIGMPDSFVEHGSVAQLRKLCGMDAEAIAAAARRQLTSVKHSVI